MHPLLERQLRKLALGPDAVPDRESWLRLLERVSHAYGEADQDRSTLERSLTLSSDEMQTHYQRLKAESETRVRAIAKAQPDLLFMVDDQGRYIEIFAEGQEDLLHRPAGALIGRRLRETLPPWLAATLVMELHRAIGKGGLRQCDYQLDVPAGRRDFEARIVAADYTEEGRATAIMLVRDVTEARQAAARDRLAGTVFEAITEGVVVMQPDLAVISVNPACEQMTGFHRGELLGRQPEFLGIENEYAYADIWIQARARGNWSGEMTATRRDGSKYPLWLNVDALMGRDGEIDQFVALMSDVSEIRRSREELERVATHDALTGLANRTLFQDRLALAVARVRRSGGQGAILFMDLDRFKPINDTLGHHVGDELLQAVAERLGKLCRAEDTLARFAGDEFTILLTELQQDTDAALVAEKVLNAFRTPFHCSGYEIEVTPSIGISVFPGDGERIDRLMQHADAAMYSAKEAGRNRYRFFTEELSQSATEYFALEQALRQALAQHALYLDYQPQYSLVDGRLCGIEALVRWQHPRRGSVPSQEFIHVAEHSGLIEQLGSLVLRKVCAQLASWREQGLDGLRVAVNLSPRQLADPDLVEEVRLIRQEFDLPASSLELELTEHAVIRHQEAAKRNLRGLAEQGVSLAMDDFGTGHSSLVNLKRFPLNRVKIDIAFVRGLGRDRNDEAIVAAIVAMSTSLGLEVVAEGVERQEQLAYLQSIGCHQIQGYLCGRPMSPEALGNRLSISRRIDVGRLASSAQAAS